MDFGKAFAYVFEDEDWIKKIGIAGLVMLIPLLGQIIIGGWALEIVRRVIRRDPEPLPDWSNFVDYLVKGLQVMVIGFAYALPIILITACSQGLFFAAGESGEDAMLTAASVVMACLSCVSIIYGIFIGFVLPAALGNFAESEQFGAAFRFGEVFGLVRAAPAAYLLVLVGSFLAGIISMLGIIACVIGLFLTIPYAAAINGHLQGQAYLEAKGAQDVAVEYQ